MSQERERRLIASIGKVANGYQHDEVVGASANIILNSLRQSHARHIDAEEELEALFESMRRGLRNDHYDDSGRRKERRLILPPLGALLNS